jgi:type II secretory pathway pseudopilin PulG
MKFLVTHHMSIVKSQMSKIKCSPRGSLLLELLVVISILAIILSIGSQAVMVSLRSGKVSGEVDVASSLASEALESVRGATEEKWQNIYNLTKTSQNYYATTTNNKWVIATGTETIMINNASYTRDFIINNISRDPSTRLIESSYNSAHDDPSTQQIVVTVSWTGGAPFVISEYFFRWKNRTCNQTSWSTSGSSGVKTCPDTTYGCATNLGTPGASLQVQ